MTTMQKYWLAGAALTMAAMPQAFALVSVGERMAQDENYRPLNIKAGSFYIAPGVDAGVTYDDNIYATDNNTESDFVTTVSPKVAVRSNWNRHAVNALAKVTRKEYADNGDESHTNSYVGLDGKLDVARGTAVGGGISWQRDHEDRGDPNSVATATEPTQVDILTMRAGAYREAGRVKARFDSQFENRDYKNGYTSGGALINNNLRDRNEYKQTLELGYQAKPETEVFVRGSVDSRVYDNKGGGGTALRSSHGKMLVAGTKFDVTGKTQGELFAGVMQRNYVAPGAEDVSKPTWGGRVLWNATDLTSVKASIERDADETITAGSSSYVNTAYKAGVEHALRRNVLVDANLGYTTNEYQGNAANQRDDDIWEAGVGASYLINRNLKARLAYGHTQRESNIAGGDYDRNRVMMTLSAAF